MENFFWDDQFYFDIGDLIDDVSEDENLEGLEDDWSIECNEAVLEPIIKLSAQAIFERFGGDMRDDEDGNSGEKVIKVLSENIDFEKIHSLLPELYYPTRNKFTITKQDLLEWIK